MLKSPVLAAVFLLVLPVSGLCRSTFGRHAFTSQALSYGPLPYRKLAPWFIESLYVPNAYPNLPNTEQQISAGLPSTPDLAMSQTPSNQYCGETPS